MAVYALWYGGASYSSRLEDGDVEAFPSLQEARAALLCRYNDRSSSVYPTDEERRVLNFPCVTDDAYMLILEIKRGKHKEGYNPGAHGEPLELWSMKINGDDVAYAVKREKF